MFQLESVLIPRHAIGLAEYWDADTGTGGGAVPQSWTGLAVVMAAG